MYSLQVISWDPNRIPDSPLCEVIPSLSKPPTPSMCPLTGISSGILSAPTIACACNDIGNRRPVFGVVADGPLRTPQHFGGDVSLAVVTSSSSLDLSTVARHRLTSCSFQGGGSDTTCEPTKPTAHSRNPNPLRVR